MIETSGDPMAFLVTSYPGQPGADELARQAAAGVRPRKAYVELARMLQADVIDSHYLKTRATLPARAVARRVGLPAGQVFEAFLHMRRYQTVCAWADRLGVPLAMLHKFALSQRDIVLVSDWLSRREKAFFVRYLKAHSALRAIVNSSSVQRDYAIKHLGVSPQKLHLMPLPVDQLFWSPADEETEDLICAVGIEARDYLTLFKAVDGLRVRVELALGTIVFAIAAEQTGAAEADGDPATFGLLKGSFSYRLYRSWSRHIRDEGLPPNVRLRQQLKPLELRRLYARSRFVVVPLHDVDSDCGMSTITEAMAMGKAVVVTRTRGQVDVVRDGEQGIYVPPGDVTALRSAIEYLLAHPDEAERMGRAGRALVEDQHTLDSHVGRLGALLVTGGRGDC